MINNPDFLLGRHFEAVSEAAARILQKSLRAQPARTGIEAIPKCVDCIPGNA
jgi:hypothetical protein